MSSQSVEAGLVGGFVPPRSATSRKGGNGRVLVVGGSYIYHGAPTLSSMAALRAGADLVYTAVPSVNVVPVRAISPDLIVLPLADQKLTRGAVRKLLGVVPKDLDSATIGMGLAVADRAALKILVGSLLDRDVRLSLDASALVGEVLPLLADRNVVLTPHAGEFARLFGESPPDDLEARVRLVRGRAEEHGVTILLKGPTDVICDSKGSYTFAKRVPAMTVGGTGDVLSGLVAGLLARNRNAGESAAAAAYINGTAGQRAQDRLGLHITATDLIGELPGVMKQFDRIE